jgi:glyoxalase family protein
VHHIAWCDHDGEHARWREHLIAGGAAVTEIIDRQYFLSIYFREPRGVLFELATPSPGFAVDEDPQHLGEQLRLPPQYEQLRERLERSLTPLENPHVSAAA